MSIKKVSRQNGDSKWEVRVHESGRGSKRIKRIFDKKVDAEKFLFDFHKELKEKALNPFKDCSFENRKFKDEAEYWLNQGELRFSKGHLVRSRGVLKELYPKGEIDAFVVLTANHLLNVPGDEIRAQSKGCHRRPPRPALQSPSSSCCRSRAGSSRARRPFRLPPPCT